MMDQVHLFNRLTTLHRISMMCHIAKIMKQGDTFRMMLLIQNHILNFDGDEMNLHMQMLNLKWA